MKFRNTWLTIKQRFCHTLWHKRFVQVAIVIASAGCMVFFYRGMHTESPVEAYDFSDKADAVKTKKPKDAANEQTSQTTKKEKKRKTEGNKTSNKKGESEQNGKININQANKETLMQLPHIGAKKADDIIAFREANEFTAVEDLMEVKGIGAKIFEKIVAFITV